LHAFFDFLHGLPQSSYGFSSQHGFSGQGIYSSRKTQLQLLMGTHSGFFGVQHIFGIRPPFFASNLLSNSLALDSRYFIHLSHLMFYV